MAYGDNCECGWLLSLEGDCRNPDCKPQEVTAYDEEGTVLGKARVTVRDGKVTHVEMVLEPLFTNPVEIEFSFIADDLKLYDALTHRPSGEYEPLPGGFISECSHPDHDDDDFCPSCTIIGG